MSKKKDKKPNANCNQVILDHFWNLSGPSQEKRCKSVQVILQNLSKQVENQQFNDLSYCLERLIRGLTSSREFARHGFSLLLAEILMHFPEQIELEKVIETAKKEFGPFKSDSDSVIAIAWILLLSCLILSGRIHENLDEEILTEIYNILFNLGTKKRYLGIVICELMPTFLNIFKQPETLEKIIGPPNLKNKDDLFEVFWMLLIHQKHPDLNQSFVCDEIYPNKDFSKIIKIIKETTEYLPKIHPIIELLITFLKNIDPEVMNKFYSQLIDDLFKNDITKVSLGLEIVPILLKHAQVNQIETIMKLDLIRYLIQTLSNKKHPLHNASLNLSQKLIEYSADNKNNSELQITFAKCFIKKPGSINFDELSRSKLLFGILKNFNNDSIKEWVSMLINLMAQYEDITPTDFYRVRCLQQITHLLKCYTGDSEFLVKYCISFLVYSYFKMDEVELKKLILPNKEKIKKMNKPMSDKLREQFNNSFHNILSHLCSQLTAQGDSKSKIKNLIQIYSQLQDVIMLLIGKETCQHIDKSISMKKLKETLLEIDTKLKSFDSLSDDCKSSVFHLLYLYFSIEALENLNDIQNILSDFNECVDRALSSNKKHNSNEPVWSDVLVELFITIITKSKYSKNVILISFKQIVPFITNEGIKSLNEAFSSNQDIEIMDTDDDDGEEEEEEENMEIDENSGDGNQDSEEDEDDDDDLMEDMPPVDEQFKNDLIKALGPAIDKNDIDEDDDSEYLSDSEMFKLDDSLAEVFRKKFGDKKRQVEKKNLLQSFKLGVLDLISALIDQERQLSMEIVLPIVINLLNYIKSNHSAKAMFPVTNKCVLILSQISKSHPVLSKNVSKEDYLRLFDQLLHLQSKVPNAHNPKLHNCLISLTTWTFSMAKKDLESEDPDLKKSFMMKIETFLKDFFERSNNETKADLFKIILPQMIEMNYKTFFESKFYSILHDYSLNMEIRMFKRCLALDLLTSLVDRIPKQNKQEQEKESEEEYSYLVKITKEFLEQLSMILKNLSKSKSYRKEITYSNSIMKLLISLNAFQLKKTDSNSSSSSLEQLKADILIAIISLTKNFRKLINKTFVHQLKNSTTANTATTTNDNN